MNSLRRCGWIFAWLIAVAAGDEPKPRRLTTDGLEKIRPSFAPDGRSIVFARIEGEGSIIRQYVLDPGGDTRPEGWKRITDRNDPEYHAVFAPDGDNFLLTIITFSGTQGNLDIHSLKRGETATQPVVGDLTGKLAHQEWPAWSPDGKRFAFSSTHDGNQEIYVADPDGKEIVRVTSHPGHDAHPAWTPGGELVYSTDRWGGLELARSRPDGTGTVRLTTSPGIDDYPAVARDGRLAWVSRRFGNDEILMRQGDDSEAVNLSNAPDARDQYPGFAPDGRSLVFVSDRESAGDFYLIDFP